MILFNWEKVYKESGGKATKILAILDYIVNKPLPVNLQDPVARLAGIKWEGKSFLINPKPLLTERYYTAIERAQYLGVASRRNYGEFLMFGKITLDLIQSPLNKDTIKNNRLLSIEGNKVIFKWEEHTRRKR